MDVCSDVEDVSTLRLFISVLLRFMITEGGIFHLIYHLSIVNQIVDITSNTLSATMRAAILLGIPLYHLYNSISEDI